MANTDARGGLYLVGLEVAEEAMSEAAAFRQQLIWWLTGAVLIVLVLTISQSAMGLAPLTAFTQDLARISDGTIEPPA